MRDVPDERINVFSDHIAYLFPIEEDREFFLNWLACLLQYPERRCITPLHVSSAQGTGRGTLGRLIMHLIGAQNFCKRTLTEITGTQGQDQYNEWQATRLLCQVDESRALGTHDSRYRAYELLKELCQPGELQRPVKRKHVNNDDAVQCYVKFLIFSNHLDAIAMDVADRRFWVCMGPSEPQHQQYYDTLHKWIEQSDNQRTVYWWLMQRDLSQFDGEGRPPNESSQGDNGRRIHA